MVARGDVRELDLGAAGRWSWVDATDPDVVLVTATGGVAARRAADLWSDLEWAFEVAAGRRVIADLTDVAVFDAHTITALIRVARAANRRRDDFRVVMRPSSALAQYARWSGLDRFVTLHSSRLGAWVPAPAGVSAMRVA